MNKLTAITVFSRAVLLLGVTLAATSGYGETDGDAQDPIDTVSEPASAGDEQRSKWFLVFGAANLQPRLEPSELQIKQQINNVFGRVFPRWEEPRTFRDWRDEFRLWDVHLGFGRELSPKWVWISTFGGSIGTVRNEDRYYPLGIPTMFHVDFSRKLWFASTGLLHYPWGQSVFTESEGPMERFRRSLKGARPFVGGVAAYLDLTTEGVVQFDLPLTSFDPRIVQKERMRTLYLSPRAGVDIPLTKRDDLILAAGYLFFCEYGDDLDNWSYYILYKHRFKSKARN